MIAIFTNKMNDMRLNKYNGTIVTVNHIIASDELNTLYDVTFNDGCTCNVFDDCLNFKKIKL